MHPGDNLTPYHIIPAKRCSSCRQSPLRGVSSGLDRRVGGPLERLFACLQPCSLPAPSGKAPRHSPKRMHTERYHTQPKMQLEMFFLTPPAKRCGTPALPFSPIYSRAGTIRLAAHLQFSEEYRPAPIQSNGGKLECHEHSLEG